MIGDGREGGIWAQSLVLSVVCHGAAVAYFFLPILDLIRFEPDVPEPMAVTLSVMEIAPDTPDSVPEDPVATPPDAATEEPEPEVLAAVEPGPAEETALEPEQIAPLADPQPEVIAPVAPATLNPIRPEGEGTGSLAPVGAEALQPVAPVDAATAAALAITPVAGEPITVAAVQSLPVPPAPAPASDPEATQGPPSAVDEFILRIRGQLALPCLVATPRRDADGAVALEFMAANEADILTFSNDLLADFAEPPPAQNVLVDPRQCNALNFVREGARYPTFPLAIAVQSAAVTSGDRLVGALQGAGGRYVSMIVIDDNGVVQDLTAYLSFSGDTVRFDIPMSRFGPARDTQQLLMAMATSARPLALDTHDGFPAAEFFPVLRQSVDRNTPLAMIPFRLQ
jgi:hypothetical protein